MRRGAVDGSHVLESLDIGPVLREDASAEGINFDLPSNVESGALESKIEASDTGEQTPNRHGFSR